MTIIIHLIYKNWPSYSKWLELPVQAAQEAFNRGQRHDSLGKWGRLSEVDPRTGVPRELNDEEVLQHGIGRGEHDDPTGDHALGRYRTNQVLSTFVRGAIQLGYRRQHFLVDNHIREGTEVDTSMVHSSCAALLCKLVGKITGYRQFSMLSLHAAAILPATSSTSTPSASASCGDRKIALPARPMDLITCFLLVLNLRRPYGGGRGGRKRGS